ncbi:unnamed protein product [Discosporangium mesarthrocarpum]
MRKFPRHPGAPASTSSARLCFSWLWLGPGSYPMGPRSMARLASGQSLRVSKQSAASRTVLLVTWKSNPSPRTGNVQADDDIGSHSSYQGKDARSIYTQHLGPAGRRHVARQEWGHFGH